MSEINYQEATRVAKVIAFRTQGESDYVTVKRALLVEALKDAYVAGFNEASHGPSERSK